MDYQCEADYQSDMGAEAEAQASAGQAYNDYLDNLFNDGKYLLWALEIVQDELSGSAFKKSGLSIDEYITKWKEKLIASDNCNLQTTVKI